MFAQHFGDYSPGLCYARPPSLRLRRKEGIKLFFSIIPNPLSRVAEERVAQRSVGGVSNRRHTMKIYLTKFDAIYRHSIHKLNAA